MSVAMTVRIPEFFAERLEELSKVSHLSKTDLVLEGLAGVFANRMDNKILRISDSEFEGVLDLLTNGLDAETQKKLNKTLETPYPWEKP